MLVWWGTAQPGLWRFIIWKRDHSLSFGHCLNFFGGKKKERNTPRIWSNGTSLSWKHQGRVNGEGFNWTRKSKPLLLPSWNPSVLHICISPAARAFHDCFWGQGPEFWTLTNQNRARGNPETFSNSTQRMQIVTRSGSVPFTQPGHGWLQRLQGKAWLWKSLS